MVAAPGSERGRCDELRLSPVVCDVRKELAEQGPVSAIRVAQALLKRQGECAQDQAARWDPDETDGEADRRSVEEWLAQVDDLYLKDPARKLDERSVVIGLGLLSHALREQLHRNGFWDALIDKLDQSLDKLLNEWGKALLQPSDHVRPLSDNPLERLDQDELGRAAFARFLARRIAGLSKGEGSYAIHLYGPWGAGKSTLLNFLCEILQQGAVPEKGATRRSKWLVVEFNAWRHQHVHPPWWVLLDTVFQRTSWRDLWPWDWVREYWWRFSAGRGSYLVSMAVLIALVWVLVFAVLPHVGVPSDIGEEPRTPNGEGATVARDMIDMISKLAAAAVTLWGIASAVAGSLLISSPRAAQNYVEVTRNPMTAVKDHFKRLIERLGYRVVVLIDDLDRCRSEYVVEFLEGIQTLFRDAPVVYVVAADRRWLNACYEEIYQALKPRVHAPGKSLGTLFLEKTFQLATPVPAVPPKIKERYWRSLIEIRMEDSSDGAKSKPDKEVDHRVNMAVLERRLRESQDPVEQQEIRRQIVARLAEPEVVAHTEHALKKFAPLLEPNPRAMKRLVNAYITQRALATLCYIDLDRDQLALWTILSLRWPLLADALTDDPELLERRDQPDREPADEPLRGLLDHEEVRDVIKGEGITRKPLDAETVRQWAQLRA